MASLCLTVSKLEMLLREARPAVGPTCSRALVSGLRSS